MSRRAVQGSKRPNSASTFSRTLSSVPTGMQVTSSPLRCDGQQVIGDEGITRRAEKRGHGRLSLPALAHESQCLPVHLYGAGMEHETSVGAEEIGDDAPGDQDRNQIREAR